MTARGEIVCYIMENKGKNSSNKTKTAIIIIAAVVIAGVILAAAFIKHKSNNDIDNGGEVKIYQDSDNETLDSLLDELQNLDDLLDGKKE